MSVMTPAEKAELLRRRMAFLRRRMDRDVLEMKESGRQIKEIFSWQTIYRQAPWPILGATALAGFVLSPGRRVVPEVKLHPQSMEKIVASTAPRAEEKAVKSSMLGGLVAAAGAMLTQTLVSSAMSYGQKQANRWLAELIQQQRNATEREEVLR